jgi:hypothetical protein
MNLKFSLFRQIMIQAAVSLFQKSQKLMEKRQFRKGTPHRYHRGHLRGDGPSVMTVRCLRRAIARGYRPKPPTVTAMLRHRWYQKLVEQGLA